MKKPDQLKTTLLAAVAELRAAPEKLAMFIDKGRLAARATGSLSFEYRYSLNIVVQDYAGDIDALMVPILAWIATNQPDLLDRGAQEPFAFESEILDGDCADVSIDIELTERVLVERREGGLGVTHLAEPLLTDAFDGVDPVNLWRTLLDDMTAGEITQIP